MRPLPVLALTLVLTLVLAAPACSPTTDPTPEPAEARDAPSAVADAMKEGSFVETIDGRDIHYEIYGYGPPMMVVPNSWGLTLEGLRGLFQPLEERLTMIYFDPRGMGQSGPVTEPADMSMKAVREDFDALREHLDLETVFAIGWSNGASNLIELAADHPSTISRAIFVHGVPRYAPEDSAAWEEKAPEAAAKMGELMATLESEELDDDAKTRRLAEVWLEHAFPAMLADPDEHAEAVERAFATADFNYVHFLYTNDTVPGFDLRDRLPQITARSLVIAGSEDLLPPARVNEIAEGIPDARYELFEESGHFAPIEQAEKFQDLVFEFLELPVPDTWESQEGHP
jgi:proline iminopeptidase